MDKIQFYNRLVEVKNNKKETTENFLDGIKFYFFNIEFFYTFLKAVGKKYSNIVIFPSFYYKGSNAKSKMQVLFFKIDGENNENICKILETKINVLNNRHGRCQCKFKYIEKNGIIALQIFNLRLKEGEIDDGNKKQHC